MDEQGHGRSDERPGASSFEASVDDAAALLRQLGVGNADVMGFCNGASIAMQMAYAIPRWFASWCSLLP